MSHGRHGIDIFELGGRHCRLSILISGCGRSHCKKKLFREDILPRERYQSFKETQMRC